MKKYLSVILVLTCLVGLMSGCSQKDNTPVADSTNEVNSVVTQDTVVDSNDEVTTDVSEETTTDTVVVDTATDTTEESTQASNVVFETDVDMRRLTGIYFDGSCLVIQEDKMILAKFGHDDVETYNIISIGIEEGMLVDDAIFGVTYRITGKAADGTELIICTDGRLARDYNYNEEYDYFYCENAFRHVSELREIDLENLPTTFILPTFSDEIESVELDADLYAEVAGYYYVPDGVDYYDEPIYETAFAILDDGYIYEWDNGKVITSDAEWNKIPIVNIKAITDESYNYRLINVETRYNTYEFYNWYEKNEIYLEGKYNTKWYSVEVPKVDALPSNVPAIK